MRLLSFDTSSYALHLCLLEDGKVVYEHVNQDTAANRQDISRLLLPEIDKGIKAASWKKADIGCVVVGLGPGSFTGIRSSVVTARTLAQALDLPCLGVSLFDCYASLVPKPAAIVLKAGPEQVFLAICSDEDDRSTNGSGAAASFEPVFLNLRDLALMLSVPDSVTGLEPDKLGTCHPERSAGSRLESGVDSSGQKPLQMTETVLPAGLNSYIESSLKEAAGAAGQSYQMLPEIKNIAIIQAQIASGRLSLQVPDLNPSLLKEKFSWSEIEPLYVRSPSVTVGKSNGNPH